MNPIAGALLSVLMPLAAQEGLDQGHDQTVRAPMVDSNDNNAVNRESLREPSQDAQMARIPGDQATPRSQWKTGDRRSSIAQTGATSSAPEGRRAHHHRRRHHHAPRKTP